MEETNSGGHRESKLPNGKIRLLQWLYYDTYEEVKGYLDFLELETWSDKDDYGSRVTITRTTAHGKKWKISHSYIR